VPQFAQNRALAVWGWPHCWQERAKDAPQPAQMALSSEIAELHTRQRMSARKSSIAEMHLFFARRQRLHGGSDCLNHV
jgi:transposase-like protein